MLVCGAVPNRSSMLADHTLNRPPILPCYRRCLPKADHTPLHQSHPVGLHRIPMRACRFERTYDAPAHESTPAMKTSPAPPIKSIENASNLRSVASILSSLPTRDINPNNNTRPQIHHPDRLNPNLHHHNHDVAQVPPRPYLPLRVRHRCSHRHPCHHSLPL